MPPSAFQSAKRHHSIRWAPARQAAGKRSIGSPRARGREEGLDAQVGKPDGGKIGQALDAEKARPPLGEELAAEAEQALELEGAIQPPQRVAEHASRRRAGRIRA